tara:strand:- start:584 stop:1408 length:825 start_codon:yes stop_codon:yes gene_type:complete
MTNNYILVGINMLPSDQLLIDYIKKNDSPGHIILIDPDSQTSEIAVDRCIAAINSGSKMILVGGSTGTDNNNVDQTVIAIQQELLKRSKSTSSSFWNIPVLLFPACANAFSSSADGITFMMLMNSKSTKYLIQEQIKASSLIKKSNVTPISMGYIVCEPGGKVGEVGEADLIRSDQVELMKSYAICAENFGFSLLYLEAGSGANNPVSVNLIKAARSVCDLPIIVGGGIRNGDVAKKAVEAGANWIVTGNLTEEFSNKTELENILSEFIIKMKS